jgi:hypothetical protein
VRVGAGRRSARNSWITAWGKPTCIDPARTAAGLSLNPQVAVARQASSAVDGGDEHGCGPGWNAATCLGRVGAGEGSSRDTCRFPLVLPCSTPTRVRTVT